MLHPSFLHTEATVGATLITSSPQLVSLSRPGSRSCEWHRTAFSEAGSPKHFGFNSRPVGLRCWPRFRCMLQRRAVQEKVPGCLQFQCLDAVDEAYGARFWATLSSAAVQGPKHPQLYPGSKGRPRSIAFLRPSLFKPSPGCIHTAVCRLPSVEEQVLGPQTPRRPPV